MQTVLDHLARDVRYGCRLWLKAPGFTLLAVVTFALGIGVNVAVFSVVNAALFKPFYGERPGELIEVFAGDRHARRGFSGHSYVDYLDFREASTGVVSGLAAFYTEPGSLASGAGSERINVGLISENYFSVFGVAPLIGRGFLPQENATPGAHHLAIISEGLWQRLFASAPDVTARAVSVNGASYAIVGVVPEGAARMFGFAKIDVFVPAMMQGAVRGGRHWLFARGNHEFLVVGRLRPGATIGLARATFHALGERLQQAYPAAWRTADGRGRELTIVPAAPVAFELRGYAAGFAALLMGAVGMVLLVGCSNLAAFLIARTLARRGEIATRLALGATRRRVVLQLLTESLLLAAAGGVVGLLVAVWTRDVVTAFMPALGLPLAVDLRLDRRVLTFCVAAIVFTAVASALPGALQASASVTAAGSRRQSSLRNGLIVAQVAVSLALVICGGLFIGSLGRLLAADVGFESNRLALLSVNLGTHGYSEQQARAFFERAADRLQRMPNVEAVSAAARVPMDRSRIRLEVLAPQGVGGAVDRGIAYVGFNMVDDRYFETMRIPMLRGRAFAGGDGNRGRPVIVNDAFARWFWPDREPVGQTIRQPNGTIREVIGVVRTTKYSSISERASPFLYLPISPARRSDVTLHVRTRFDPTPMLEPLRRELLTVDPAAVVFNVRTMNDHLADSLLAVRVGALVLGSFGALTLALAAIGLYGVVTHAIVQRRKELGIRLALGARPLQVCGSVLRLGLSLTSLGLVAGVVLGVALAFAVSAWLPGLTAPDLPTVAAAVLIQCGIALVACWVPARRAVRVDPIASLRCE